jgi:hypothetical protein
MEVYIVVNAWSEPRNFQLRLTALSSMMQKLLIKFWFLNLFFLTTLKAVQDNSDMELIGSNGW